MCPAAPHLVPIGNVCMRLIKMSVSIWAREPGTTHRFSLVANWDQGGRQVLYYSK